MGRMLAVLFVWQYTDVLWFYLIEWQSSGELVLLSRFGGLGGAID